MLFASSNCRYMDVLRNKRVINDKWTKSEGPNYAFLYSDENYKEKMIFYGKSYIIWIVIIKYYTYKYVLQYFMGFCAHGVVF